MNTTSVLVSAVRFFRLLRLIRLAKVARAFFKSDLKWVEEDCFQGRWVGAKPAKLHTCVKLASAASA